jgi:DNA-binding beta-propeller fold protein YncE
VKTDPAGNFLYVTNFADGTVSVFAIDPATGELTAISGSPFGAGAGAVSVAIDPAGTFAYVANETAATISAFSISSATGTLTPVRPSRRDPVPSRLPSIPPEVSSMQRT